MFGPFLKALQEGRRRRLSRRRREITSRDLCGQRLEDRIVPAATAVFSATTGVLSVFGDAQNNTLTVSRDAAGRLNVNGGAVNIVGGVATVANTSLIQVFGQAGNDTITLNEANGALPAANLFGGTGNDVLTGGSGNDLLFGQAGNDTLLGKGGFDFLFGGTENDTLTGGDADDQVFGEAGDDRMIWNPGDDTDLNEGGAGNDTVEVNGGNGSEVFTVTANGTRVRFDRLDPAPFAIDIGTSEKLVLNANGGDDSFSATGNLAALISITVDGGTGNDTILGSNGADLLRGGDGDDFIDGQQGTDTALMGAGNDVFQWDPGDGNDVVEGQDGVDTMLFNGSAGDELMELTANGARLRFTRNLGSIVMDVNDTERVNVRTLGGVDKVTVNNLAGTDVTEVNVDLGTFTGGGDGAADTVVVNAHNGVNTIDIIGAGTSVSVLGLTTRVNLTNVEPASDSLVVNTLGGNDTIDASALPAIVKLVVDGGTGNDKFLGSAGDDFFFGGDGSDFIDGNRGNDVAFLGAGNDTFQWDPGDGNDTIEGQDGIDAMVFNGANIAENVDIFANGGRVLFVRDVASVTMDLNDVEKIRFNALGGADRVTVGDLSGTDVTDVDIDLASTLGGANPDGAADSVIVNGTNGDDNIKADDPSTSVVVTGLAAKVNVLHREAIDRLTINGQGGSDVINASAIAAAIMQITMNGGLGNDLLIGSAGNDLMNGGDGNDTALMGAGDDTFVWNPGDDNDVIEGQAGFDTMQFNGANVAEIINISANGGRVLFTRDIANVVMDLNDTERVNFAALGGADQITVNDLSGTDLQEVNIDLASTLAGNAGDGAADTVIVSGTSGDDVVVVAGGPSGVSVLGLAAQVNLFNSEAANDRLVVNARAGDDVVEASGLAAGAVQFVSDGEEGDDVIVGSDGNDVLFGSAGDDVLLGGLGQDVLDGGPGSNVVIQ